MVMYTDAKRWLEMTRLLSDKMPNENLEKAIFDATELMNKPNRQLKLSEV